MSTKNITTWLAVIILAAGGVYYFSRGSYKAPTGTPATTPVAMNQDGATPKSAGTPIVTNKVEISASGFSPSAIKVKVGDTVTWTNNDSAPHWPATAMHPAHEGYDGTNLAQHCAAGAVPSFDACKGLAPGESYSFKFDKVGTWKYHDHVKPVAPFFGSVVVE